MASRFFFALCVIALFVAIASAQSVEEADFKEFEDDIPRGTTKLAMSLLEKALKSLFKHINKQCLVDAVHECGFNVLHPKRLYKCGAAYFEENKERCIIKKADQ